jgi:biopolymer transport protein ExbB
LSRGQPAIFEVALSHLPPAPARWRLLLEAQMPKRAWLNHWGLSVAGLLLLAIAGMAAVSAQSAVGLAQENVDNAAAAPAKGGAAPAAELPTKSQLRFYVEALGKKYTAIFLLISFVFVALIVMNVLAIRRQSVVPPELVQNFETLLNEKRYQEAYDLAKNDESFLGHVLSAGLAKLQDGYPQALEAMQEVGEDENMKLEQRLSYIALIGTISPMVGLLGTVEGMVDAFQTIAGSSTQPKPSDLAKGISMALITTLVGLWLAIPAIAIFGIFRNRLARLVLEVGIFSERLMSRFQNVGVKK